MGGIFIAGLLWSFYCYEAYAPVENLPLATSLSLLVTALFLGGLGGYGLLRQVSATPQLGEIAGKWLHSARTGEAFDATVVQLGCSLNRFGKLLAVIGTAMLTSVFVFGQGYSANALLDQSPAEREIVVIREVSIETYKGLFRQFRLTYSPVESDETTTVAVSPQVADGCETEFAIVELGEGYFGWRWLRQITPVSAEQLEEVLAEQGIEIDEAEDGPDVAQEQQS